MSLKFEFDYAKTAAAMKTFSQKDIDELKDWCKNLDLTKLVPKDLSDKQLILFYNACESDVEKTKTCIEKYFLYKKNAPEFFENRNVTTPEILPYIEALEFSYLPEQSPEGYDIIFHRLHHTEPSKYNFEVGVKLLFMTAEACLYKRGPQRGYIFLFDMRGVKLGHLMRLSLTSLRKFFQYVQEAAPLHMRAIHVLNTEPVLDKLLMLIKPFMNKELYDIIKFHNKNMDMEDFYAKILPRSALPADFGGHLENTQVLHKICMKELQCLQDYFDAEEKQRKTAIPDKNNKIDQAFKKLEID